MWSSTRVLVTSLSRKFQLQQFPTLFTLPKSTSSRFGASRRSYSLSRCCLTKSSAGSPLLQSYAKSGGKYRKLDRNRIPGGGWLLLIIPVSTLGLGIWQVYRWRWKLGLIDEMRSKSIADPVPLPQDLSEIEKLDYRKVKVSGTFDYSREVLIGPRSLVPFETHQSEQGRGVFSSGSAQNNGYLIITPFKVDGTNDTILVNRGWIGNRNYQKFKHVERPVELVGIVRKNEPRAPFMSKTKPGGILFHYRDVPTMARVLDAQEVFLDLFSIDGVDFAKAREESIPVPKQTRVTLRNEHVSYYITWFSLSAITALMWHRRFIKGLNLL